MSYSMRRGEHSPQPFARLSDRDTNLCCRSREDLFTNVVGSEVEMWESLDLLRWASKRQEGQTMAEYAVVLGVITLAVVAVFTALAGGINGAVSKVTSLV
jgi:Flp pilus assembly pilin Flp